MQLSTLITRFQILWSATARISETLIQNAEGTFKLAIAKITHSVGLRFGRSWYSVGWVRGIRLSRISYNEPQELLSSADLEMKGRW